MIRGQFFFKRGLFKVYVYTALGKIRKIGKVLRINVFIHGKIVTVLLLTVLLCMFHATECIWYL